MSSPLLQAIAPFMDWLLAYPPTDFTGVTCTASSTSAGTTYTVNMRMTLASATKFFNYVVSAEGYGWLLQLGLVPCNTRMTWTPQGSSTTNIDTRNPSITSNTAFCSVVVPPEP